MILSDRVLWNALYHGDPFAAAPFFFEPYTNNAIADRCASVLSTHAANDGTLALWAQLPAVCSVNGSGVARGRQEVTPSVSGRVIVALRQRSDGHGHE